MNNNKKILIIVQRSNGDVFFSNTLIKNLKRNYPYSKIDLLVNDDTIPIAELINGINKIYSFSYREKKEHRFKQEISLVKSLYKNYDLSINLTASDRSVLYCILSGRYSISAVERNRKKSWWKRFFLSQFYFFDPSSHILINNLNPLNILNISYQNKVLPISPSLDCLSSVKNRLKSLGIDKFIIFHPAAQYQYKVYPKKLRNELFNLLNELSVKIIVTGGNSIIDNKIKQSLPSIENVYDFINKTTMEEYIALSSLSIGYLGMDTLNMHIAASQDKKVFAIFGPTNLKMWSPWSNISMLCAREDNYINEYDNITVFQADLPCVACGKAGCNDQHDESLCLNFIDPEFIYQKVQNVINDQKI